MPCVSWMKYTVPRLERVFDSWKAVFEVNLPFEYTELTASYPCKICEQPQQSGVCSDAQANLKCPGNKQQC